RQRALAEQGLVSSRDRELAELSEARARTSRDSARASETAARSDLLTAQASLAEAEADAESKIASATASLESSRTDVASTQASLASLEVTISRTQSQRIVAPRDGTVLRYLAGQGGEQVKEGDALLEFIPDDHEPAVELWVDGNDAALIRSGAMVRLQFEGWPAVQFSGWPSVAVGTFGGRVAFVDSADDGRGNFRVVVLPDPDDEPWPAVRWLRQGVRSKGWFLLNEVSIGYEVWRQLNGFPPRVNPPGSTDATYGGVSYGGSGGSGYGGDGSSGDGGYGGGGKDK
ncbi:MAG: HlyD family efflux transporter periplasmic adaptor subunit, partial [Myxococcota bacterium]